MLRRALIPFVIVLAGCSGSPTVVDSVPPSSIILLPDAPDLAPEGMFVAEFQGSAINDGNTWVAVGRVLVLDDADHPVAGALVTGEWSEGENEGAACTTDADGECDLESDSIQKRVGSAELEVTNVEHDSLAYLPELDDDFDPDGESLAVTVFKP